MTDLPVLLNVAPALLALASVAGIAWARRHDHRVRRQAARLQGRLEVQLEALRGKEQKVKDRIGLIVELYRDDNLAKVKELTQACNDLLATVESLRVELHSEVGHWQQLRGRALREEHDRMAAMAKQGWELACAFEERHQSLRKEMDGLAAAKYAAARTPRSTRPARPTALTDLQSY